MDDRQATRRGLYVLATTALVVAAWLLVTPYYGAAGSIEHQSNKTPDHYGRGTRALCKPLIVGVSLSDEYPLVELCRERGVLRYEYMWVLVVTAITLSAGARVALGPRGGRLDQLAELRASLSAESHAPGQSPAR